jgi:hypothetical protein
LLDRSGHGKVFQLINRRRFQQIEVLEGLNILVCISGRHHKMRVYFLSWLRNKILKGEEQYAEGQKSRHGYTVVGNLEKCIHFKIGECSLSVADVSSGCSLSVADVSSGCSLSVADVSSGCSLSVADVSSGCSLCVEPTLN